MENEEWKVPICGYLNAQLNFFKTPCLLLYLNIGHFLFITKLAHYFIHFPFFHFYLGLYLNEAKPMDKIQWIGIIAGILTASSMLPQVIKVMKEKKAEEISLLMLIVLITGITLWVVYGVMKKDMPIIATNAFSLLVNGVLIVLRIKYRHG
jgi:MtN3 and saliva related transmembrane protein